MVLVFVLIFGRGDNLAMIVQLFVTCLIDSLFPQAGEAVVHVLSRAGAQVEFPAGQTCCGQPAYNAGFTLQARQMARQTIRIFEKTQGPIVVPSGSCAVMIRQGYPELFHDDPTWLRKAQALASRTYEFSAFLVDELGVVDTGAAYHGKMAYHPSCHLFRDLQIDRQPLALLDAVEGAQIHRLRSECCGFGGLFAIDQEDISVQILHRKLAEIEAANVDIVVGCDVSCLMHMEGGLRRKGSLVRCAHLAQILANGEAAL
jgi:L-lactate dehydrogenase complex protein LldE